MSQEALGQRRHGTLAQLIEEVARGLDSSPDEAFARGLAASLHQRADHISLPEVDALKLCDVVVTLYMDREMRLVVTGTLESSGAEASLRWREADFPRVALCLHEEPRRDPYLFATLDFAERGKQAVLLSDCPPGRSGDEVKIRCLATLGREVEYRVRLKEHELSVPPDALRMSSRA